MPPGTMPPPGNVDTGRVVWVGLGRPAKTEPPLKLLGVRILKLAREKDVGLIRLPVRGCGRSLARVKPRGAKALGWPPMVPATQFWLRVPPLPVPFEPPELLGLVVGAAGTVA